MDSSAVKSTDHPNAATDKFALAPHLVGTNYEISDALQSHKDKYNPVDLGLDYFDGEAPKHIRNALANATLSDDPANHQYAPGNGSRKLREAIAEMYSPLIGRELDATTNVMITTGATGAVYAALQAHTLIGDEWILVEPAYSIYAPMIRQARGLPRFVSLKLNRKGESMPCADDWEIDKEEFESSLGEKTKGILLNNPVNPIGKIYSAEELQFIADVAKKYNLLVVCDEAPEWITFKSHHIRIASLPEMFERTVTIGSASKTFSLSGWRIGWAFGPEDLVNHVKAVHMHTVKCCPMPQQEAIAFAFNEEIRNSGTTDSYLVTHLETVRRQRDLLVKAFSEAGLIPIIPDAGFCMLVDCSPMLSKLPDVRTSMDFVKWLVVNVGMMGFPGSLYFSEEHEDLSKNYVRFCYHKKIETLEEAALRLKKLKNFF